MTDRMVVKLTRDGTRILRNLETQFPETPKAHILERGLRILATAPLSSTTTVTIDARTGAHHVTTAP